MVMVGSALTVMLTVDVDSQLEAFVAVSVSV